MTNAVLNVVLLNNLRNDWLSPDVPVFYRAWLVFEHDVACG